VQNFDSAGTRSWHLGQIARDGAGSGSGAGAAAGSGSVVLGFLRAAALRLLWRMAKGKVIASTMAIMVRGNRARGFFNCGSRA